MSQAISISDNTGQNIVQELQELSLAEIVPNPSQPRRDFDQEALQALAGSIGECGVLQPVLVRPRDGGKYELVAGERRWRASGMAGLETIPALVSAYEDLEALEVALIEKMAREDLNPVEEARACTTLMKELGLNHGQIADRVGRSRSMVANLVRLLDLSAEILDLLQRGELGLSHGLALLVAKDPQVRDELARAAIEQGWSVTALRARAGESRAAAGAGKDAPTGRPGRPAEARRERPVDADAQNVARAWGEVLGVAVEIRPRLHGRVRLEVEFNSPEAALASAQRFGDTVSRGSTGS